MTEKEQDQYFIQILDETLKELKVCAEYEKNYDYELKQEIEEDNNFAIEELSKICKKITSIDDLAELGEDSITVVFEAISSYAENFVISAEKIQRKKDLKEYEKIEEILFLFCDADDEE